MTVIGWALSTEMFRSCCADESSQRDGVDSLRKAAAVHAADWELLRGCFGSGQMICVGSDQKSTWTSDIQFEIQEKKLWYLLSTVNSEPSGFRDVDKVEIVADGEAISNVAWSNRFRPNGCKIYVRKEGIDGIFAASSGDRIDIRRDICPVFLRSRSEQSFTRKGQAATLESEDSRQSVVVVTNTPDRSRLRYVFSKEFEGRLVRLEQIGRDSVVARIFEYEWQRADGIVQPKCITLHEIAYGSRIPGFRTHILSIEKLKSGSTGREFLLTEATVCEGARVIDYRPGTKDPVRGFSSETNGAKTLAAEVGQMPIRQGDRPSLQPAPVANRRVTLIRFLFWFNILFVGAGGCLWWYRNRNRVTEY
jgi:hypothetical protein